MLMLVVCNLVVLFLFLFLCGFFIRKTFCKRNTTLFAPGVYQKQKQATDKHFIDREMLINWCKCFVKKRNKMKRWMRVLMKIRLFIQHVPRRGHTIPISCCTHIYNQCRFVLTTQVTLHAYMQGHHQYTFTNAWNIYRRVNDRKRAIQMCTAVTSPAGGIFLSLPLYCFRIKRPLLCKQRLFWTLPLTKVPTNKCFISLR